MHKSMFEKALTLSHVPRWAIVDTLRKQTVADHSYRTIIIALELADRVHKPYPNMNIDLGKLAILAAYHDVEEGITGDIPTPFKRSQTNVIWPDSHSKPDGIEGAILHMADAMEAVTFLERYGTVKEGRVMKDMWDHVGRAKERLFSQAIKTYNHHMPGMDPANLDRSMTEKLEWIVNDMIHTGHSYE